MKYVVYADLVSDYMHEELEEIYISQQTSPEDFLVRRYHGQGGCGLALNPDAPTTLEDSPFSGLDIDLDSDPALVEGTGDGPELIDCFTLENGGWEVEYCALVTVNLTVEAENETQAAEVCRELIPQYFSVFELASSSELDIVEIRNLRVSHNV